MFVRNGILTPAIQYVYF